MGFNTIDRDLILDLTAMMSLADCVFTHAVSESLISHGWIVASNISVDTRTKIQTTQPVFHLAITDLVCSRLAHDSSTLVPMVQKGQSVVQLLIDLR